MAQARARLGDWWRRLRSRRRPRPLWWRIGVPVACACVGLLAITSMMHARGTDLRGGAHSSLIDLVDQQRSRVTALQEQAEQLQDQVSALSKAVSGNQIDTLHHKVGRLTGPVGLEKLSGPGIVVTLDDSPKAGKPTSSGIDQNLLVVHQQDIQAVVNALWAGDAKGISLQGVRLISTTGIKCVGNTVLLHGVPYSPPYRIVAIGNPTKLYDALQASRQVQIYREYIQAPYHLGWSLRLAKSLTVPAYEGTLSLEFAQPVTP